MGRSKFSASNKQRGQQSLAYTVAKAPKARSIGIGAIRVLSEPAPISRVRHEAPRIVAYMLNFATARGGLQVSAPRGRQQHWHES